MYKVYAIYELFDDCCTVHQYLVDLYADEALADYECLVLNETKGDNWAQYEVHPIEVK